MAEGEIKRLIEIMAEMLDEQRLTREEQRLNRKELEMLNKKTEEGFSKVNVSIGELRLSVMKLATEIEVIHDHEKRIGAIEKVVFK